MKRNPHKIHESDITIPVKGFRVILILFLLPLFPLPVFSQDSNLQAKWSGNTAFLMPAGKWESGIFQSFRYGLNGKIELRSDALLMPLLPNAGIKVAVRSGKKLLLASEHTISCPTVFLNIVSFKGTGGLISPQFDFPLIITLSNTLIATLPAGSSSLLTADAGLAIAIRGSKPDYQSSIDIPFIYQRMAHYYEGLSVKTGISFKGTILKKLYFEEGARIFVITRSTDNFFIENYGALLWATRRSLRIKGGYLLSWGRYPFGNHLQLWPSFDFIFGSRNGTKGKS